MTSDQLSAIAGVILSLVFSYAPKVSDWFDQQPPTNKRLVMAALLLLVAGGAFGLSCAGAVQGVTCNEQGVLGLVNALIAALVANQAMFIITPRVAAKKG